MSAGIVLLLALASTAHCDGLPPSAPRHAFPVSNEQLAVQESMRRAAVSASMISGEKCPRNSSAPPSKPHRIIYAQVTAPHTPDRLCWNTETGQWQWRDPGGAPELEVGGPRHGELYWEDERVRL